MATGGMPRKTRNKNARGGISYPKRRVSLHLSLFPPRLFIRLLDSTHATSRLSPHPPSLLPLPLPMQRLGWSEQCLAESTAVLCVGGNAGCIACMVCVCVCVSVRNLHMHACVRTNAHTHALHVYVQMRIRMPYIHMYISNS